MGAASPRGAIGCSTREKPSPRAMKRTPIAPIWTNSPAEGDRTSGEFWVNIGVDSMQAPMRLSRLTEHGCRSKTRVPAQGARAQAGGDPPADHGGDRRAAPDGGRVA